MQQRQRVERRDAIGVQATQLVEHALLERRRAGGLRTRRRLEERELRRRCAATAPCASARLEASPTAVARARSPRRATRRGARPGCRRSGSRRRARGGARTPRRDPTRGLRSAHCAHAAGSQRVPPVRGSGSRRVCAAGVPARRADVRPPPRRSRVRRRCWCRDRSRRGSRGSCALRSPGSRPSRASRP